MEFMRTLLSLLIGLAILPFSVAAQQFKGRIMDANNGQPIAMVLITNLRSGSMWLSDSSGFCAFTAVSGDQVRFEHTAYRDFNLEIHSVQDLISVRMERAPIELKGVEVISPYTRFSRDSAFMRQYFHKELGYSGSQVKLDLDGGVGARGMISDLALSLSGKKKRAKQFAHDLQMLEEWRYEAIRYTPQLVMSQTGLDDSTARMFIVHHPMPYDLLRTGSELALKSWVRDEFQASGMQAKPKPATQPMQGTTQNEKIDSLTGRR